MPIVHVHGPTGLSKDQKRTMIKRITDAVHEAWGALSNSKASSAGT
jgi:phenylpyruvate tautomerase PptA (4-oxalocrotonate tautomerase family)